jgi:hypothetical protein
MKKKIESKEYKRLRQLTELAEEAHKYGTIERHLSPKALKKFRKTVAEKTAKGKYRNYLHIDDPLTDEQLHRIDNTHYGI